MFLETIIHKISKTGSNFHVKGHTIGKLSFLLLKSVLLALKKLWFWQKDWVLGYHSMEFKHFPDIS